MSDTQIIALAAGAFVGLVVGSAVAEYVRRLLRDLLNYWRRNT